VRRRLTARYRRTRKRSRNRRSLGRFCRSDYCCRLRYPRRTLSDIEYCVFENLPEEADRAIVRYIFFRAIPRLWYVLKASGDRQRLLLIAVALAARINIRAKRIKVKLSGAYYYRYSDSSEEEPMPSMAREYYPVNPLKWRLNKASASQVDLALLLSDSYLATLD
jgi:hypothetical protein